MTSAAALNLTTPQQQQEPAPPAAAIRADIGARALFSMGAGNLRSTDVDGRPALTFDAYVEVRHLQVVVAHTDDPDQYEVTVEDLASQQPPQTATVSRRAVVATLTDLTRTRSA